MQRPSSSHQSVVSMSRLQVVCNTRPSVVGHLPFAVLLFSRPLVPLVFHKDYTSFLLLSPCAFQLGSAQHLTMASTTICWTLTVWSLPSAVVVYSSDFPTSTNCVLARYVMRHCLAVLLSFLVQHHSQCEVASIHLSQHQICQLLYRLEILQTRSDSKSP